MVISNNLTVVHRTGAGRMTPHLFYAQVCADTCVCVCESECVRECVVCALWTVLFRRTASAESPIIVAETHSAAETAQA